MIAINNKFVQNQSIKKYSREIEKFVSNNPGHKFPQRFVIFNFPRSGSNLLCGMLNKHPEILCHHEIFNPQKIYYSKDFHQLYGGNQELDRQDLISGKVGLSSKLNRNLEPEKFILKIWQHNFDFPTVGFNLFPSHIPNAAMSLVKDKEVRKILLRRRNKVKCYVSRAIARKTGRWDSYKKSASTKKTNPVQVKVNPNHLLSWSRRYDRYFETMSQSLTESGQSFLELTYEDLVGSQGDTVKANLLNFIGVAPQIEYLQPPLKKQNSDQLTDLIINFAELKNQLLGSELECLLD